MCRRDVFVVERYRDEAFADAPIRVEEMGFNISAPHMHAACLEALALRPGMAFLDVGVGCGVVAAAAALIVGPSGSVAGIDVRRECVQLSRANVARLAEQSPEFAAAACPVEIEVGNCFITAGTRHRGRYDCVHVGACCPPAALPPLLELLKPGGGRMVCPVAPSDLRLIVKKPNGAVTQKVISQVRFSELEVPTDAEVVLSTLRLERKARTTPPRLPSTFAADGEAIAAEGAARKGKAPACAPSSSPVGVIQGLPPSPSAAAAAGGPAAGRPCGLAPEVLGPPDCVLVGAGWELAAHSAVLRQRCDHFRARAGSGMRDAALDRVPVPSHFSRAALEALLRYLYADEAAPGDCHEASALLHVAQYYGVQRLGALCEVELARALRSAARHGDGSVDGGGFPGPRASPRGL
jgi:protein-L-isoaspartate(D-aspartate) O-methyltransferase